MYVFLLLSLILQHQMVNKVKEANTHQNLRGMYSQSVFVTSPTNVINTQGLDYKCI